VPLTPVTFNPGEMTKQVTIQVIGDTVKESDEQFKVVLYSPTNATLAPKYTGWGTIINDD
jgi:hypothetical protein